MFHPQERMIECIFYACKLTTCYPAPAVLCMCNTFQTLFALLCSSVFHLPQIVLFSEKKKQSRGQKFSKDVPRACII